MKPYKKIVFAAALAAVFLLSMTGCGAKQEEAKAGKEYKSKDGGFSINVPGEFTESPTGNDESIILDNKDASLSVMVQRFPKEIIKTAGNIETLDDFVQYYHTNAIAGLLEISTVTEQELNIEGMTVKAEELVATVDDTTAKAYNAYIESETGFYAYTITGLEDLYDDNIKELKETISQLKELK